MLVEENVPAYSSKVGSFHAIHGTPAAIGLAALDDELMNTASGPRMCVMFARHFGLRWEASRMLLLEHEEGRSALSLGSASTLSPPADCWATRL